MYWLYDVWNNRYLFISSDISNTIFPLIYNCEQIKSIYILNKNEQYQDYSNGRRKVQGIFNVINKMFERFRVDISTVKNLYYSEQSTFQNINQESAEIDTSNWK
jgi:hypothetical protein